MRFSIKVTAAHIRDGRNGNPLLCPLALAARERFANRYIIVGTDTIDIEDFGEVTLSPRAQAFVEAFDQLGPSGVEPFRFVVAFP